MAENAKWPFYEMNGEEVCQEEPALAQLLAAGELFANGRKYLECGEPADETTVLFVQCNDIFAWGCADAESLPFDEIGNLYRMWHADKSWGTAKWCALRRKQQPQGPVIQRMKQDGSWDEMMESLGPNTMDAEVTAYCKALFSTRSVAEPT